MATQSAMPQNIPDLRRHIVWRFVATVAVLLLVGSAVGGGVGYVLARGIDLLLSGIV